MEGNDRAKLVVLLELGLEVVREKLAEVLEVVCLEPEELGELDQGVGAHVEELGEDGYVSVVGGLVEDFDSLLGEETHEHEGQ